MRQPADMTVEELAGQRLMVGFDGTAMGPDLESCLMDCRAGGIILFARNCETPDQVRALLADAQGLAATRDLPPLWTAVDQEGGVVKRLKSPFTEFPGNPAIDSPEKARAFGERSAAELHWAGFNMNLAPVMDVPPENGDSIMKKRVFPGGPSGVGRLGAEVIRSHQENGVLACAKHFPGIGHTTLDSHLDLPVSSKTLEELWDADLPPFEAAVRAGAASVMLTHVFYPELDPGWPASLSVRIARNLLRKEMGFTGLVLTDDLDMGAIEGRFPIEDCMERSLAADVDLILLCHPGPKIRAAFDALVRNLKNSPALLARARQSVERQNTARALLVPPLPENAPPPWA